VVTYRRVEWAVDSFAPYKSRGVEGIFPGGCNRLGRWSSHAVPSIWPQVKEVFIPQPHRNSYGGPRDYRPISLKSFLLKAMERLVDRYLRDEALAIVPLHPNQHAYQAGK
jgi:hypothetical protein